MSNKETVKLLYSMLEFGFVMFACFHTVKVQDVKYQPAKNRPQTNLPAFVQ